MEEHEQVRQWGYGAAVCGLQMIASIFAERGMNDDRDRLLAEAASLACAVEPAEPRLIRGPLYDAQAR